MPSQREKYESCQLSELFDLLANHSPGDLFYQSASAELLRRRALAQDKLEEAQLAVAKAQTDAAEYARQGVKAMRQTVFWTGIAAAAAFLSTLATWLQYLPSMVHH
jgi:hypothetical protein